MVDNISNVPPPSQGSQAPEAPKLPASRISLAGMPDPFPGLKMTDKEKKMFWTSMVNQMNSVINRNTEKAREAIKKMSPDYQE